MKYLIGQRFISLFPIFKTGIFEKYNSIKEFFIRLILILIF